MRAAKHALCLASSALFTWCALSVVAIFAGAVLTILGGGEASARFTDLDPDAIASFVVGMAGFAAAVVVFTILLCDPKLDCPQSEQYMDGSIGIGFVIAIGFILFHLLDAISLDSNFAGALIFIFAGAGLGALCGSIYPSSLQNFREKIC